jgi:hypothetical protein
MVRNQRMRSRKRNTQVAKRREEDGLFRARLQPQSWHFIYCQQQHQHWICDRAADPLFSLFSCFWLSRALSFGVLSRPRARIKYKTLETCCAVCEWVNKFIFTAPAQRDVACEGSGYSLAAHATGSVWVLFPKCPQTPFLQAFTKILSALHTAFLWAHHYHGFSFCTNLIMYNKQWCHF